MGRNDAGGRGRDPHRRMPSPPPHRFSPNFRRRGLLRRPAGYVGASVGEPTTHAGPPGPGRGATSGGAPAVGGPPFESARTLRGKGLLDGGFSSVTPPAAALRGLRPFLGGSAGRPVDLHQDGPLALASPFAHRAILKHDRRMAGEMLDRHHPADLTRETCGQDHRDDRPKRRMRARGSRPAAAGTGPSSA